LAFPASFPKDLSQNNFYILHGRVMLGAWRQN
jgi:hypothetical protein